LVIAMARLLDALLLVDALARTAARAVGTQSHLGRHLRAATADLRRQLATHAMAEEAATFDPKTDLKRIFSAAEAAGLSWPDMRDALNDYHTQSDRPRCSGTGR
jgi:hypothetical protein